MSVLSPLTPSGETKHIQIGDLVIVYERFDSMKAVKITEDGHYQNRYGNFYMKEWIGLPFGSQVASRQNKGWVYLLLPTAELWTLVLKHRTQILYLADIATICCQLDLKPGSIVLESGTGSGSLSTSLARTIAPTGQVYTFEFHEQRALDAAKEFEENGLGKLITVEQRNIEELGFPETLHGKADAVFLDLPGPWKAIPSAAKCLRPDGVFCGFSPCIEQVQNTVEALNAEGFRAFSTIEILLREYEISNEDPAGDEKMLEKMLIDQENGPRFQRGRGGGRGRGGRGGGGDFAERGNKKARFNKYNGEEELQMEETKEEAKTMDMDKEEHECLEEAEPSNGLPEANKEGGVEKTQPPPAGAAAENNNNILKRERVVRARPVVVGRGHTGYLTFARKAVDFLK